MTDDEALLLHLKLGTVIPPTDIMRLPSGRVIVGNGALQAAIQHTKKRSERDL